MSLAVGSVTAAADGTGSGSGAALLLYQSMWPVKEAAVIAECASIDEKTAALKEQMAANGVEIEPEPADVAKAIEAASKDLAGQCNGLAAGLVPVLLSQLVDGDPDRIS